MVILSKHPLPIKISINNKKKIINELYEKKKFIFIEKINYICSKTVSINKDF